MNVSGETAIILAAGESSRMGSPKPLLPFGTETVLERSVNLFLHAGISDVRVVIGHLGQSIRRRFPDLPVKWIYNEKYESGMLSSVQKGVATLETGCDCFLLLPVDIPLVRPRTISVIRDAWHAFKSDFSIIHPTFIGKRGHPPLISSEHIPEILACNSSFGLKGFLDEYNRFAKEIPVIDEFIEKDMDTPEGYEILSTALGRYELPTRAECTAMLSDTSMFSEKTAAHCRQVASLATYLGKTVAACDIPLDLERINAGALLHDIAKGEKNHAAAGAEILMKMGFSGITDIVSAHMDIDVPKTSPITESEVVYLADKLVQGDTLVTLSARFERKLAKYGHDPSTRDVIHKRRACADAVIKRIEHAVGRSFLTILADFSGGPV